MTDRRCVLCETTLRPDEGLFDDPKTQASMLDLMFGANPNVVGGMCEGCARVPVEERQDRAWDVAERLLDELTGFSLRQRN